MIGPGIPITFQEPDVTTGMPSCIPLLAAAFAHGWRLANDDFPNHEDVTTGARHIADFKRAHPRRLTRFITLRFLQKKVRVEGEDLRIEEFLARCNSDRDYFHAAQAHPRFSRWRSLLIAKMPFVTRHLAPTEHVDYGRFLIVPIGGDPALMERMDRHYQSSWS